MNLLLDVAMILRIIRVRRGFLRGLALTVHLFGAEGGGGGGGGDKTGVPTPRPARHAQRVAARSTHCVYGPLLPIPGLDVRF